MPKYSTVQAYTDTNANLQTVSYEQATGGNKNNNNNSSHGGGGSGGGVKTEKVVNPYGSTAGANSGDFHLYRQTRAREMQRMASLDEAALERQKDDEYRKKLQEYQQEEESRTNKRRKKRQRQKEAKVRRKNLAKAGIDVAQHSQGNHSHNPSDKDDNTNNDNEEEEEEFPLPPPVLENMNTAAGDNEESGGKEKSYEQEDTATARAEKGAPSKSDDFVNDGSFLEMAKKALTEKKDAE